MVFGNSTATHLGEQISQISTDSNKFRYMNYCLSPWLQQSYNAQGPLTQSHLKPKVTLRNFPDTVKLKKSIYIKTMFLFHVFGSMVITLNRYGRKRNALVRI